MVHLITVVLLVTTCILDEYCLNIINSYSYIGDHFKTGLERERNVLNYGLKFNKEKESFAKCVFFLSFFCLTRDAAVYLCFR